MEIVTWNVNGLRSAEKKGLVEWILKNGFDHYCLQEVRCTTDQISDHLINIPGYELHLSSASKKGYAGVGIYTKHKPKKIINEIGHKKLDAEGRFLRLDFENYSLMNLYIPNGGREKQWLDYKFEAYDFLFGYLKDQKQKYIVLVGDFNIAHKEIDLAHPKSNKNNTMFTPREREQLDRLLEQGYIDTFRKFHPGSGHYTWWANYSHARERNLGWRIDYVLITKQLESHLANAYILNEIKGSDHCPAGISLNLP